MTVPSLRPNTLATSLSGTSAISASTRGRSICGGKLGDSRRHRILELFTNDGVVRVGVRCYLCDLVATERFGVGE